MAMTAMRGGLPHFRMPGPLLGLLYELGNPGAKPLPTKDAMGLDTPEHRRWGVIETVMVRDPEMPSSPDRVPAIALTDLGRRLHSILPMARSRDRRSLPPLIPIARLLAVCSDEDRDYLRQSTPLQKTSRGYLFEALGVITPAARGDYWVQTTFLTQAFAHYESGRDGPMLVNPFVTPMQTRFLRKALVGVSPHDAATDGRSLKPLGPGYMGLVTRDEAGNYHVAPSMRPFVRVAAVSPENHVALFEALPSRDQEWLAEECLSDAAPHHYLLDKMGWIYWKNDRWNLSPMGREMLPAWKMITSAPVEGVALPNPDDFSMLDMTPQPDGPDDIYMVDLEPDDPFDALDMEPSTPRHVGKHPALAMPYAGAPPPRIDNLYRELPAKDDFDIL